jgi:NAD(P)-dependent dehydrogenase (short-subunit alcohol dehydrogenase family)
MGMGLGRGKKTRRGITVNAVAPGFTANIGLTGHLLWEAIRSIVVQTPSGQLGKAKRVGAAV